MRTMGLAMTLAALAACTGGDGDGDPVLPATLVIDYSWAGFDNLPEENCASAWVDTLYIELEHAEGDYNLRQVACDNDPVEIPDLRAGAWTIEVRTVQYTDEAASSYGQSDLFDIELPGGETTELDVPIECQDNGHTCDRTD